MDDTTAVTPTPSAPARAWWRRSPSARTTGAFLAAVLVLDLLTVAARHDDPDHSGPRLVEAIDVGPLDTVPPITVTVPGIDLPPVTGTVPPIDLPPVTVVTLPKVTVPPILPKMVSVKGKIVFHSSRGSVPDPPTTGPVTPSGRGYNVWVMDADGSNVRPLTTTNADGQPDLSTDGTHLAWVRGDNQVWRMEANGTGARMLATCPLSCGTPRWSPSGDRIAYVSYTPGGGASQDVVVMRADGSAPRTYPTPAADYDVAWDPNGTRLAVNANEDATKGLYILDLASGVETKIVADQAGSPDWSPDGTTILWGDDHSRINAVHPDGTGNRILTPFDHQRFEAQWSPDGQSIVYTYFAGVAGQDARVAIMRADGTGERFLTDGTSDSSSPTF